MELFKKLRLRIGKAILSNKAGRKKRVVRYTNFSDVRNIGIVWDASKTSEFSSLGKFHQKMLEMKIDVKILGYFTGKNLPDQYTAIRYLTCFRKDEISTFYYPASSETNSFINNAFDVLIDINPDKLLPLRYVTSLSNAHLKVGLLDHDSDDSPLDLLMELKNPVDIDSYLTQVIHYLGMIKSNAIKTIDKKTDR